MYRRYQDLHGSGQKAQLGVAVSKRALLGHRASWLKEDWQRS